MSDETGWLIEFAHGDSGPTYYGLCDDGDGAICLHIGATHDKAVRYARHEDAQMVAEDFGWSPGEFLIVEHMWCSETLRRPEPQGVTAPYLAAPAEPKGDVRQMVSRLKDAAQSTNDWSDRELFNRAAAMIQRLAARAGAEWRSMDSAPRDGTWILAASLNGNWRRISWGRNRFNDECWCSVDYWWMATDMPFTAWQPLPAPPHADGE